jgi:hypothetical protein
VQVIGLVVPVQIAVNGEPLSTLKVTAPLGAKPVPVHANETLNADAFGYVTVVTAPSVRAGACLLTLKLVCVAEAAE